MAKLRVLSPRVHLSVIYRKNKKHIYATPISGNKERGNMKTLSSIKAEVFTC